MLPNAFNCYQSVCIVCNHPGFRTKETTIFDRSGQPGGTNTTSFKTGLAGWQAYRKAEETGSAFTYIHCA